MRNGRCDIWHVHEDLPRDGLESWITSPTDVKLLTLQRSVRLFAYGGSTIILALFLSHLNVSDQRIGLFMTLTLLGDVAISLVLTVVADRIGRRRMLAFGALMMAASGIIFALFSNYWILVLASVLGVISPRYTSPRGTSCFMRLTDFSGNEIGPFKAIEESTISHLIPTSERSNVLTWYIIAGLTGTASGTIIFGWLVQLLQVNHSWSPLESYRVVFWVYAAFGLTKCLLVLLLSGRCEPAADRSISAAPVSEASPLLQQQGENERLAPKDDLVNPSSRPWLPTLSQETRALVVKLCFLFGLDSLASGLAPVTWMTYYFNHKYGLSEGHLGTLFFVAAVLSAASNLVAPALARRLGLIKTMVFTHIPASLALAAIPVPNNVALATTFLLFRASTNSMDQAPRQAFLAAAVQASERTAVMGIVNVVKTLSQSAGPFVTGVFAYRQLFGLAFIIAGALKIVYDILMLVMFLGYQTVEERAQQHVECEDGAESANREEVAAGDAEVL
ncbi:major facilitator superfamily domain-containing protein [Exophiala viscosa]|uniref:Major facilitator superfamily domain-containing protein n=1 Tax=Exophiala viscosa TaxID=2486360 RepID=A0AAN6IJK1_9EURO|nr:major facilitator superfamily domain-containing protein [Exophiala viscosa]